MSADEKPSHRFRAVLFDLDGTLIDSVTDIASAVNLSLARRGYRTFDTATIAQMVGAGARTLIDRAMTAARADDETTPLNRHEVDACYQDFIAEYEAAPCVKTRIFRFGREAMDELKAHGCALGVVTNKPHGLSQRILELLGVEGEFGSVVGASDRLPLKPAPDMILAALSELGVTADAAVMVGDSAADVGSAHAAGIPCVVLTHGYTPAGATNLGADEAIAGFGDLTSALRRLSG